ncbi:MAG: hypothetical protein ACP5VR_12960, partial [Acidimicrobiales bacterium]
MTSVLGDEQLFEVELGGDELPRPSAPAGEAKTFRRYDQDQCFLLPPSLDDWLPEDHEARFVSEVVEHLSTSPRPTPATPRPQAPRP